MIFIHEIRDYAKTPGCSGYSGIPRILQGCFTRGSGKRSVQALQGYPISLIG
jgi:hypothetical protein